MNTAKMCLFGGALVSAGLSNPALCDVGVDGTIIQTQFMYGFDFGAGIFAYAYGVQTIDTFDFTVLSDGQIQLDMLSWDIELTWIDSNIFLFNNDGASPGIENYIDGNDDGPELGLDLNGSLSSTDSFLDIFLTAGDYTVGIASFLMVMEDVASGEGLGLVWDGGGNGMPTTGQYHLDIFGDVAATSPSCPADLTGDGQLDFFDVSAFLTAFGNGDPVADFTNDGLFDFFDVSEFLSAFAAGCP